MLSYSDILRHIFNALNKKLVGYKLSERKEYEKGLREIWKKVQLSNCTAIHVTFKKQKKTSKYFKENLIRLTLHRRNYEKGRKDVKMNVFCQTSSLLCGSLVTNHVSNGF